MRENKTSGGNLFAGNFLSKTISPKYLIRKILGIGIIRKNDSYHSLYALYLRCHHSLNNDFLELTAIGLKNIHNLTLSVNSLKHFYIHEIDLDFQRKIEIDSKQELCRWIDGLIIYSPQLVSSN